MPSLKEFMDAMNASWPVALAIFLGATAIVIGHYYELPYIGALPEWVVTTLAIMAIFSLSVLIVSFVSAAKEWCFRFIAERRTKASLLKHAEDLADLPANELDVLRYAAGQNTQVFLCPMNHHRVEPLIVKHYVTIVPGMHSVLEWPHRIPDHIWAKVRAMEHDVRIQNPFRHGGYHV